MYLGKKENTEENLDGSVVLALTKCLENMKIIFFDNYKSFWLGRLRYRICSKNRKALTKMTVDRNIKKGGQGFSCSKKASHCKWFDNQSVAMLFINVEVVIITSTVLRRQKTLATKVQMLYPDAIKESVRFIYLAKEQSPITWNIYHQLVNHQSLCLQLHFMQHDLPTWTYCPWF